MLGYIFLILGSIVTSLGLPSRSGRKGSAAPKMFIIGLIITAIGAIVLFIDRSVIESVIGAIVAVFLLPGTLANARR